jgi:hypothetical protein
MQSPNAFYPVEPDTFLLNSQGLYIGALPGDVEPYTLDWQDSIDYSAETVYSMSWSVPAGVAIGPNSALYGAPLAVLSVAEFTSIVNGSFALAIDGGAVTNVTGVSFVGLTTFAQIAVAIQTAVRAALTDLATVTFDTTNSRFVFTSPAVGPNGNVSFLTPVGTGTDISGLIGGTSALGAYQAPGVTAAGFVGPLSTLWIATPVAGMFLISATMTSSLNRVKTKTFQLQVA